MKLLSVSRKKDIKKTAIWHKKEGEIMALKELYKKKKIENIKIEKNIKDFISKGGTVGKAFEKLEDDNHRLTLRIPKFLLDKIDIKRKERIGKISRNLWILETLEKAIK